MKIGLIGDYQEAVTAHRAIPKGLALAADAISVSVEYTWLHSSSIPQHSLEEFDGLWCVPASPYEDDNNVLNAIGYARTNNRPFLGTCGGYQYAALEFARTQLGYPNAENAEVVPATSMPLISGLSCKLYDKKDGIKLIDKSIISGIYDSTAITEEYYCGYGVNAGYLHLFEGSEMVFSGFDGDGDPRCLEIPANRFYIGTAFQPERSSINGEAHPLICAYLMAIKNAKSG
ncbi:MAG: hypothetical protein AAF404_17995 [Pseudomonadota bacterium]